MFLVEKIKIVDSHTYSKACTTPGADDALFQISGTELQTNTTFDYENPTDSNADGNYKICLRVSDGSLTYDKNFTITIMDIGEGGPTLIINNRQRSSSPSEKDTDDSTANSSEEDSKPLFIDIFINNEAFEAIKYLKKQKIILGYEDGSFQPEILLNRAELATILTRLANIKPSVEKYNNCFPDVNTEWYAPAVCYANEQGWMTGYKDGELSGLFAPEKPALDIEVLVTLSRLKNWKLESGTTWYEPALKFAQENQIYTNDAPIKTINRKTIAKIIFNTLNQTF